MSLEDQMRQLEADAMAPAAFAAPPRPKVVPSETSSAGDLMIACVNLSWKFQAVLPAVLPESMESALRRLRRIPIFRRSWRMLKPAAVTGAFNKAAQSLSAGSPREAYLIADKYGCVVRLIRDEYLVTLIVEAKELNWGLGTTES